MITDDLLDEYSSKCLDPYHDMDYSSLDDEEDFIEETVNGLSHPPIHSHTDMIETRTRSVHQSPKVTFEIPTGDTVERELADLLYLVTSDGPGRDETRRGMLTQAKFAKDPPSWDIDLYQHHLIEDFSDFVVTSPRTCEEFSFGAIPSSFANFGLASRFRDPIYLTGSRMEEAISNFDYRTDSATFNPNRYRTKSPPTVYEYSQSILKRLIRGTYGTEITSGSEIDRLVDHLNDIVEGSYTTAPSPCTDGGVDEERQFNDPPGFTIVNISITIEEPEVE